MTVLKGVVFALFGMAFFLFLLLLILVLAQIWVIG